MELTKFDRASVKELRGAIKDALASVEASYGITFEFNTIRFSDRDFSTRLQARVGSDVKDHAKADWDATCGLFGLKPEDFGRTFTYAGNTYKVAGIKPRSKKYPIIAENAAGTRYKMPTDVLN